MWEINLDNIASSPGSHRTSEIAMVEGNALAETCDGGGCDMALKYEIYLGWVQVHRASHIAIGGECMHVKRLMIRRCDVLLNT